MTLARVRNHAWPIVAAIFLLLIGACAGHGTESIGRTGGSVTGAYTLVVSTAPSRTSPVGLSGADLDGSAYIFTSDATGTATPAGITQVSYWLDDTAMTAAATHVESFAPYDFAGSADDGSAQPWLTSSVAHGTHTITQKVTPTSGSAQTLTATFTVGPVSAYTLLVSTSASRSSPASLAGATLSSSASAYVFTSDPTRTTTPAGIKQARYWLDNTAMSGLPTHVENVAPYDFVGTAGDGSAEAWSPASVAAGTHTITQSVTATSGAIENLTATFTVGGGGGPVDAGGGGGGGGSGTCSPTAAGPGGAGAANVPGSNVPAFPALANAFTVTGLDASGNADVGPILQAAVNAHAQIIIPGSGSFGSPSRYNVVTQVNVPAGVIVECEPGAQFLDSTACTDNMPALFEWSSETASVAGAGMYGCMFRGTAAKIDSPTSYNHAFLRLQSAKGFTIEGNMTNNSCGDADIRLDGPESSASNHGSTDNLIAFNNTENAENGIALINAWNNTVRCNTSFNGGLLDEEPNQSFAQCGENIITKNYMALTMDPPGTYWSGFSVGGNGQSCPPGSGVCATDTVTDNVLDSGGFTAPSRVYCECNAAGDACDNASFGGQWSGNILAGGTSCRCGDACTQ